MTGETHWFRVDARRIAHFDGDDGSPVGYSYTSSLKMYEVLKHTPKGVWLHTPFENNGVHGPKKFVRRDTRKRWACPTKMEALESFLQRKRRRVSILMAQIAHEKSMVADAYRTCAIEMNYPADMPQYPEILKGSFL